MLACGRIFMGFSYEVSSLASNPLSILLRERNREQKKFLQCTADKLKRDKNWEKDKNFLLILKSTERLSSIIFGDTACGSIFFLNSFQIFTIHLYYIVISSADVHKDYLISNSCHHHSVLWPDNALSTSSKSREGQLLITWKPTLELSIPTKNFRFFLRN